MKKIFFLSCVVLLALLAPLACTRPINIGPTNPATPTPTCTPTLVSTPGCGYSPVTAVAPITPYLSPTPVPTLSVTVVITPVLTPVTTFPLLGGQTYVIRNLADWQAYYGSPTAPPPPVNFSQQMLLIFLQAGPSYFSLPFISIQGVCWDSSKITVSCSEYIPCGGGPTIYPIQLGTPTPGPTPTPAPPVWYYYPTAIAVPLSSLPVNWVVTQFSIGPCPQ